MTDYIYISHWSPKTQMVEAYVNGRWLKPDPAFQRYSAGKEKPHYQLPAIPHHYFESDICTISIWPGVMQVRISDEPYTGFGMVITFEHGVSCGTRYDDFD